MYLSQKNTSIGDNRRYNREDSVLSGINEGIVVVVVQKKNALSRVTLFEEMESQNGNKAATIGICCDAGV